MKTDTSGLYQITEAANACGLSRSTLMRLEEKGLLTPAYITPGSGRRFYDNHNVSRILQIEKLKGMGLDTNRIADYFESGGETSVLLSALEERLSALQRSIEEIRLRDGEFPAVSVQMITLPAVTCRIHLCLGHTVREKYDFMYAFYGECIRSGCVLSDEPMFTMSDRSDYLEGYISGEPYPFYVCVPVREEKTPEAVCLPECRALSVLYYGDYDGSDDAWLTLGREAKARGLKPAGYPRVLGIVAPYTGREIQARRYCSRFVLPVEETD